MIAIDDDFGGLTEVEVYQHAFLGGYGYIGAGCVNGGLHFSEVLEGIGIGKRLVFAQ